MIQALFLAAILSAEPITISGRVTRVTDGDTIRVLVDRREVIVRLAGIDAPESGQPYGQKSKQALSERINQRVVRVVASGKDRYGRLLGVVYHDGENVNEWLVANGFAWQFTRYDRSERLRQLEWEARESSSGLWAAEAVAPWEFRAAKRKK